MITLSVVAEEFRLREAFTISRGSRTAATVVRATLTDEKAGVSGHGECVPYARYDETVEGVIAEIEACREAIGGGMDRHALQEHLPAGAARNALDCAFWDLEAKRAGKPVHELAGLEAPKPVVTAFTLSLDAPEAMQAAAEKNAHRPLLKVKLGGEGRMDLNRLRAVRGGAPDARLIIDANEGWSATDYELLAPEFLGLGVTMVEQPLPAGKDEALEGIARPLPVCADESCHDRATLDALSGRYDMVNIKLDKTGGLTEALALEHAARAEGFKIMVGCMLATSLAMAPAILLAQGAEIVDLDGPLLLSQDREPALAFDENGIHPAEPALWG
ncbi:N-acetyl-D-Glu racemase DgcA [Pararhizobium mangrovi]|uniref:Dipeptide epimerase n=1 Tax=Pararhizobium mangrovi TaxID=2590452 RepID=A0A506U428_9HYPH|nr:N-acetyl-D-Glu racemase DgcA [Pararhizobium mangrovi]TPW27765.1 dipeptide epimerase [Pararhizobium mangrovi]